MLLNDFFFCNSMKPENSGKIQWKVAAFTYSCTCQYRVSFILAFAFIRLSGFPSLNHTSGVFRGLHRTPISSLCRGSTPQIVQNPLMTVGIFHLKLSRTAIIYCSTVAHWAKMGKRKNVFVCPVFVSVPARPLVAGVVCIFLCAMKRAFICFIKKKKKKEKKNVFLKCKCSSR